MATDGNGTYEALHAMVSTELRRYLEKDSYYQYRSTQTRTRIALAWAAGAKFSVDTWTKIFEDLALQAVVAYLFVFRESLKYIAFHHSTARVMEKQVKILARSAIKTGNSKAFHDVEKLLSKTKQGCGLPAFDEIIVLTPDKSVEVKKAVRDTVFHSIDAAKGKEHMLVLLDIKKFLVPGKKYNWQWQPEGRTFAVDSAPSDVAVREQTRLSGLYMTEITFLARRAGEMFVKAVNSGRRTQSSTADPGLYEEFEEIILDVLLARLFEDMMPDIVDKLTASSPLPPSAGRMSVEMNGCIKGIIDHAVKGEVGTRRRNPYTGLYYIDYK